MAELVLQFDDDSECVIRLLQNEFVEEWYAHFKYIQTEITIANPQIYCSTHNASLIQQEESALLQYVESINAVIDQLETEFSIKFPYQAWLGMPQSQCNRIHRGFTTSSSTMDRFAYIGMAEFQLEEGKEVRFQELVHKINELIHYYELSCVTANKKIFYDYIIPFHKNKYFYVMHNTRINKDMLDVRAWRNIKAEHRKYFSFEEYPVYLKHDVLGKDFFNAWLDQDDPRAWDVTNNIGYSGGFHIDPTSTKAKVLKSHHVKNWLKEFQVEPTADRIGQMPLGDIRNDWDPTKYLNNEKKVDTPAIQIRSVLFY